MLDYHYDLTLSRTFKVVGGQLVLDETLMQVVQASSLGIGTNHSASLIGSIIDSKYKVLSLLGEGGMGAVYSATHLLLNKEVALKTFRTVQFTPEAWARFQREAQAIGKLRHANVIQVFDFGVSEQNLPYYTMELLAGQSLASQIERCGRLSIDEALPIFISVADGLAHAHRQGIVHRDIKPANIFMEQGNASSIPKIVDFGLAKLAESQSNGNLELTAVGMVFGSPLYMSPEQSMGLETDSRTDIYSFGCSLFQSVTGQPPFVGKNFLATIAMHQTQLAPRLVDVAPDVTFPQRLEAIVAKLLAKDVEQRYQTFEAVQQDLMQIDSTAFDTDVKNSFEQSKSRPGRSAVEALTPGDSADMPDKEHSGRRKPVAMALSVLAVSGLLFLGFSFFARYQKDSSKPDAKVAKEAQVTESSNPVPTIQKTAKEAQATALSNSAPTSPKADDREPEKILHSMANYFSSTDRSGNIIFSFPKNPEDLGYIGWKGKASVPAQGRIVVPKQVSHTVVFTASRAFYRAAKIFRLFRADDIALLKLDDHYSWSSEHLAEIGRLEGLTGLIISGRDWYLKPSDIEKIDELKNLLYLDVSSTDIDGLMLNKFSRILALQKLEANDADNIGPLLEKLKNCPSMHFLSLKGCNLSNDDLKTICTMPNILELQISSNPLTAKGLQSLVGLKKLYDLQMNGVTVKTEILPILHDCKNLKNLNITTSNWSQAEKELLRQAVPKGCQLQENQQPFSQ